MDDDGWVTIKGTHVLLQNGVAVGGGKLNGMTFSNAKSTKSKSKNSGANDPGFQIFKEKYKDELAKIEQVPVKKLDRELTDEEIINRIAGGDETKGSCKSLALAYAANRVGLDVLDFRDGNSRDLFRQSGINETLEEMGAKVTTVMDGNNFKGSRQLLNGMELGKEYILCTGRHAAVVRRVNNGSMESNAFEYLELQSNEKYGNGWYKLRDGELMERFKAMPACLYNGQHIDYPNRLIDIESLGQCGGFGELMSYINTAPENQHKGSSGGMK
jgi:hypothetical protein